MIQSTTIRALLLLVVLLTLTNLDIGYAYTTRAGSNPNRPQSADESDDPNESSSNQIVAHPTSSGGINVYHNNNSTELQQLQQRDLATVTAWNRIGSDINGAANTDQLGYAVAMNADGSRMVVAAPQNDAAGTNAGRVYIYEYGTNKAWNLIGTLNGIRLSSLGEAVSISGDGKTVCVGASKVQPWNGYVEIYRYTSNNNWRLLKKIVGANDQDKFGSSVSLDYDGSRVAIGAPFYIGKNPSTAGRGKTYIYDEQVSNEQEWKLVGEIQGTNIGDRNGHSVSLSSDGSVVAIGEMMSNAGGNKGNAGTTAVYEQTGSLGGWTQLGSAIPGLRAGERSGTSVSISGDGDIVAIGSPMYGATKTNAGMVRVFQYDKPTKTWVPLGGNILPETSHENGYFGVSVSLSDNGQILAIGEPYDSGVGRATIYFYNAQSNTWTLDTALSATATEQFGWSVALSASGTRLAVGAYKANSGTARAYEFQTSDQEWLLSVEKLEANFATGVNHELTLTFKGTAPPAATAARTYRMKMLLPSCALGAASSDAIKPVQPSGTVPSTESFQLVSKLDVNLQTVRSSGFFVALSNSAGQGQLSFCVETEILEGSEVKATRQADVTLDMDMGIDFVVTDFLGIGRVDKVKTEIGQRTTIDYHFVWYFCDEFGNEITTANGGSQVGPGGEVSVCLEADQEEPVVVDNVKAVSFENELAPLLGVPLIDEMGEPKESTTTKDCNGIRCRIAAITVPRLYEYKDSSGTVKDVHKGVSMRGMVTFAFPNRRNLQDGPGRMQKPFTIELDLAKPPDRYAARPPLSSTANSLLRWPLAISMAAFTLTVYMSC